MLLEEKTLIDGVQFQRAKDQVIKCPRHLGEANYKKCGSEQR